MRRSSFQGVTNIVRFNPYFFITSLLVGVLFVFGITLFSGLVSIFSLIALVSLSSLTITSLAVSHWIYDRSDMYTIPWVKPSSKDSKLLWLNINAGFDEVSPIIRKYFPFNKLRIMDFYDPIKHTEPSIARARIIYPPSDEIEQISPSKIPVGNQTVERVVAMFSLHEIRQREDRVKMLKELHRVLVPDGEIYVTEHLRDSNNFAAYSLGALHFYSRKEWLSNFHAVGLTLKSESKITPFVTTFTLIKK